MSLWSVNKKKPLATVKKAHGCHGDVGLEQPHWITSVAALQNSDTVASGAYSCESLSYELFINIHKPFYSYCQSIEVNSSIFAAGSHNSQVQIWKCGHNYRGLESLFTVPVVIGIALLFYISIVSYLNDE